MLSKDNRSMSIILIFSCVVFILSLFLLDCDFITRLSCHIHELIALIINVGVFLIPLEVLVWFATWRRYHINVDKDEKKNLLLNLTTVLSVFAGIAIFIFYINIYTAEGSSNNIEKYTNNQGYYMILNGITIRISKEQYNVIEPGKWYHFAYKYNKLIPDKYIITILDKDEQ